MWVGLLEKADLKKTEKNSKVKKKSWKFALMPVEVDFCMDLWHCLCSTNTPCFCDSCYTDHTFSNAPENINEKIKSTFLFSWFVSHFKVISRILLFSQFLWDKCIKIYHVLFYQTVYFYSKAVKTKVICNEKQDAMITVAKAIGK